jgi:hypothetical protein
MKPQNLRKGPTSVNHKKKAQMKSEINNMGRHTIVNSLKDVGLPSYGTAVEKRSRLRKHFGLGNGREDPSTPGNVIAELNQLE